MRTIRHKLGTLGSISAFVLCLSLQAADKPASADDAWYTEPQIYQFRPRVDRDREFGSIGVTGIEASIKKGVVLTVDSVTAKSPADGQCRAGDVILGVNGVSLQGKDPFVALGNALTQAESTDGTLLFDLKDSKGGIRKAQVKIPVLGAYSATFPLNCKKSDLIVKESADFYASQLSGTAQQPVEIGELEKSLVGLFLLSTGDDAYLPVVRKIFDAELKGPIPPADGASTWHLGYRGILCGEYYLRTGDKTVLPLLEGFCTAAKLGQRYDCGWAHKIYDTPTVYWLMNAAGNQMLTTMLLGKECGVKVDEETLRKTLRQWYRFAGHGSVPYGDHVPGGGLGSNGKDGMTAAALRIASHAEGDVSRYKKANEWLTVAKANQYPAMITGHGDFGRGDAKWRGITLSALQDFAPERFRKEMDRHKWWLDLSRKSGGGFRIATLEKFGDVGSGAVMGLFYTAPRKTLQMTGAPRSPHAKSFSLPDFKWGTEADLAFLSTAPCDGYEKYGPEEEIHTLVNRLLNPSGARGKPFPGEPLPLDYLRKNVRHQEIEIRIAAAKGLRHFGHWDELEALLRDPDPRLRRAALDGLIDWTGFFHMGPNRITTAQYTPGILQALRGILADPKESWWVIDAALFAMNAAPVAEVEHNLPAIMRWAESEEGDLRMATFLGLLGAQPDPQLFKKVLPTLTRMLGDPRKTNREWMDGLLAEVLKKNSGDPEVSRMIEAGFAKAIKETTVLQNEGLYRRQAEGLYMINHAAMEMMQQSPEASVPLASIIAGRLNEITPEMLINLVSTPGVDVGPKSRLGLYAVVARQKNAQQKEQLITLLDTAYRKKMIEMLHSPTAEERFRANLIQSIADIGKLKSDKRGWQTIATPVDKDGKWRYHSFNPTSKKTLGWSGSFTSQDFMKAEVPAGMENWVAPEFDDQQWPVGAPPIGKGRYEGAVKKGGGMHRIGVIFPNNTAWNDGHEFLMMRAHFDLDPSKLDHQLYRVGVLSAHCYKVFINGKQVASRSRDELFPRFVGDNVDNWKALNLKPGRNTIAVITNHYLPKRAKDAYAQIDVRLEGLAASELESKK
jgi:hypothetical protein